MRTDNGLPDQQTLERLVCAAIVVAYPERGSNVKDWLEARHNPPSEDVKAYSWSYMAGWYPDKGCHNFYATIWKDAPVRENLIELLKASGAWQIAERLAQ